MIPLTTDVTFGKRILIVEDSQTQAMSLQQLLKEEGFETWWVNSAESALSWLDQQLPDLVITDLNLPGVSGEVLCRWLRMNLNTRSLPILLLTSESGEELETRLLESGADDFVNKSDDDPEMLTLRIQALLRKSSVTRVLASAAARPTASRLLIVEDSPTYRHFLMDELAEEGYRLNIAETGETALRRLAHESYDVIILDLHLPDMSGVQICRHIVESRRTLDNSFMILALTGTEEREEMNNLLEAGADDVISKSREIELVKVRLRALLRRKLLFEENRRIIEDLRDRERTLLTERAERRVVEARAALVDKLEQTNRELKETQSQLVQSAKMASLGQLVAGVAHEINNPAAFVGAHLKTMQGLCRKLAGDTGSQLSGVAQDMVEKIRQRLDDSAQGVDRISDLVLKLRTFSRLDEGEFKLASVRENVEAVLLMLNYRYKDRITVVCELAEPDVIPCYPGLLNQALMNILSNSIDAIEKKGKIIITTGMSNGEFEITIQDDGKGIPAELKERIFEPFFTTKAVGEGTGLGMSITYQIVRRHDGTIKVESGEGAGTKTCIRFPLKADDSVKTRSLRGEQ